MNQVMLEIAHLPFTIIQDLPHIPKPGQPLHTTVLKMPMTIIVNRVQKENSETYVYGTLER